jgi:hypothetical protein
MSRGSRWVPPPGDDPEQDLRLPELRALAADPEIGAQRGFEAAAERVSGDRSHDRLGDLGDGGEGSLQPLGGHRHVGIGLVRHLLDIGAGREQLRATVDNGADLRVCADLDGGLTQLALDLRVPGVHRRPVEADGCQTIRHLHVHELAHGASSSH